MQKQAMKELRGDTLAARDGEIGSVDDLYFDDETWALRYLVVDTGGWLTGRKVLIPPERIAGATERYGAIPVDLTREQVERSPGIGRDEPISSKLERAHLDYYGHPPSADAAMMSNTVLPPETPMTAKGAERDAQVEAQREARASHLRSAREVVGYSIRATDGWVGHVEDFVVDDGNWTITGMVVDTRNWVPGSQRAVVPPDAIEAIDWQKRTVRVRRSTGELRAGT